MRYPTKYYPHHQDEHIGNLKRFLIASGIVIVLAIGILVFMLAKEEKIEVHMHETAIKNNSKP